MFNCDDLLNYRIKKYKKINDKNKYRIILEEFILYLFFIFFIFTSVGIR